MFSFFRRSPERQALAMWAKEVREGFHDIYASPLGQAMAKSCKERGIEFIPLLPTREHPFIHSNPWKGPTYADIIFGFTPQGFRIRSINEVGPYSWLSEEFVAKQYELRSAKDNDGSPDVKNDYHLRAALGRGSVEEGVGRASQCAVAEVAARLDRAQRELRRYGNIMGEFPNRGSNRFQLIKTDQGLIWEHATIAYRTGYHGPHHDLPLGLIPERDV